MPKKMVEEQAEEKLRIIDVIKENAAMILSLGGFLWLLFSYIVSPIQSLQYQVGDILNNHMKTLQDNMVTQTTVAEEQAKQIRALSEAVVRLTVEIEQTK